MGKTPNCVALQALTSFTSLSQHRPALGNRQLPIWILVFSQNWLRRWIDSSEDQHLKWRFYQVTPNNTWHEKTYTFSLLYRQCPIILNFLNYKRKIWTATPLSTKPNTFILFHLIEKRACNYLKCDPTFVDEWHCKISTSYQQKKGERTTGRLEERDGRGRHHNLIRALAGSQVGRGWNEVPREYVHTRMDVQGGRRD